MVRRKRVILSAPMSWIVGNIARLMIVAGVLTCSMVYALISPEDAVRSTFGETMTGPAADTIIRNWGALIALMGGMLIYGAFRPPVRAMVLTVAGASKIVFVLLVLSHGERFLEHQAGVAVLIDTAWIVIFASYLAAARRTPVTT